MKHKQLAVAMIVLAVIGSMPLILSSRSTVARAGTAASPKAQPVPVEKSMHEFMEYVFQPTYKRLKQSMMAEPVDNAAWKAIKSDALILAEGGNLLLVRTPEKEGQTWDEQSAAVRELGSKLYQSARSKDYKSARQHYEAMLVKCNSCHNKFADGEHQLSP